MLYIAVYRDEGVAEGFLPIWQRRLQQVFGTQLDFRFVDAKQVRDISPQNTHMLIMPGGHERFYQKALEPEGNEMIINFVLNGGVYLGVCGGAYYACQKIDFTDKEGKKIQEERSLGFFPGTGIGSIPEYAAGQYYDDDPITASVVDISWTGMSLGMDNIKRHYYHGGCYFSCDDINDGRWYRAAVYPNHRIAAVQGGLGRGRFFLSGVHIEVDFHTYHDFLYPRYGEKTDTVHAQCRNMLSLDTKIFHHIMHMLLVK